jgi:hypothetical protein
MIKQEITYDTIDQILKDVRTYTTVFFDPNIKQEMHIENERDFLLGAAVMTVYEETVHNFKFRYNELPDQEIKKRNSCYHSQEYTKNTPSN